MVCVCPNFQSVTISHRREKPCHQFHFAKRRSGWGEGGGKEAGRSKKKNLLWIYVGFRWRSLVKQTRKRLHEWLEKERKRMSRIVRMFRVFSLFFWFFFPPRPQFDCQCGLNQLPAIRIVWVSRCLNGCLNGGGQGRAKEGGRVLWDFHGCDAIVLPILIEPVRR